MCGWLMGVVGLKERVIAIVEEHVQLVNGEMVWKD